jgi:micrococcal nuclease
MTDGARRRPGRADHYTYLIRLVLPLAAGLTYATAAGGQETTAAMPANPYDGPASGQVTAVEDGQTLSLADGRQVRLVNILAPLEGESYAADARKHLMGLALDRQIRWSYAGRRMDRYGRLLAYVYEADAAADAPSLQARLVSAGLARVMGQPDTRDGLAPLLALEGDARDANLWPALNSFQIVEGTPVKLEHLKDRTYLNFGTDYTTDFTLTISARDRKLFDAMPWRLEDLIGRRLRIRGWLELRGGPLIEITYPEQIEVVE